MIKKILLDGSMARIKLLKGALIASEAAAKTLGPAGRNAIIQTAYKAPTITNDGVTILRHIVLDDEIEDLGAQSIVEASMKTNERVGDGTTTTALVAGEIVKKGSTIIEEKDRTNHGSGIGGGANVVALAGEILAAKDKTIALLKEMARPVRKGDIKNIIATSIGKLYPQYVDDLTDMIEKVGKDGYISVEDNWVTKYGVETQVIDGMRFLGSYASPFMVTNRHREAIWEDTLVLVTNHRIEAVQPITAMLEQVIDRGARKLVIICEGYSGPFVKTMAATLIASRQGDTRLIQYLAVKSPSLTTEQFEDVAAFVGARFFDKNIEGMELKDLRIDHLGFAKKVIVDEDDTIISGGRGNVKERVAKLKAEIEIEKDPSFKEQAKRRLGALTSGFGIIRVGASTEQERTYIKYKMEDAINAARAALDEGVIKGGGLPLKEIAEKLGTDCIIYEALCAPHKRIVSNSGGELKIPATVLDPVKVTRFVVENACSIASQLITAEVAIAETRKTIIGELERALAPHDNENFRDDENLDMSYKT